MLSEDMALIQILSVDQANIKDPENVKVTKVNSAEEMLHACRENLPVDIAIFAAAVSDWKSSEIADTKIKKSTENQNLTLTLQQNQWDILKRNKYIK